MIKLFYTPSKPLLLIAAITISMLTLSACIHQNRLATLTPTEQLQQNINTMLTQKKNISPASDIPGGAANANLETAAYYAWQEFIALNWPAVSQSTNSINRDTADNSKFFGEVPSGSTAAFPALVWETYRHKVEIYPGVGSPPGYSSSTSLGYNTLPTYNYAQTVRAPSGPAPWVNLDENSQIATNQIYAGLDPSQAIPTSAKENLILFLAKANRSEYDYVAQNKWWAQSVSGATTTAATAINNTKAYIQSNQTSPPAGSSNYVSFPNGTIEIKSAWRLATASEIQEHKTNGYISGFHSANIRYYSGTTAPFTATDTLGVLLGLHIIHKTPTAPYFIFATFEHKNNIRHADGTPVEDANGDVNGTLPSTFTTSNVTSTPSKPLRIGNQYQLTQQTFTPNETTASTYQETINGNRNRQLYYINTPKSGLASDASSQRKIGVNKRRFAIPPVVTTVNQDVHKMIASAYSGPSNPWGNYRLTNVQWKPLTKAAGTVYPNTDPAEQATYYLSNSVIETNHVLSEFSGQFSASNNTITDFVYRPAVNGQSFKNVYHANSSYLMGGCMGCHGNQQVSGNDFSFIFAAPVPAPGTVDQLYPAK